MLRYLYLSLLLCCHYLSVQGQHIHQEFKEANDPATFMLENFDRIRSMNPDTAIYYLNEIIRTAESNNNRLILAKAYEKRGIAHFYIGQFEKERADLLSALRIAESIGDVGLQGNILKELCVAENRQGNFKTGIRYGYAAIELCTKAGDNECLASAQRNLGRTYLKIERRDSADYFLIASYNLKVAIKDSFGIPFALNDLSELAMRDGKVETAKSYLVQSADIRKAIGDSSGLAITLNNIGEIYLMSQQPAKAVPFFEKSIKLSAPLKFVDLQRHSLDQIGIAYQQIGDYESAYQKLIVSQQLNDSLYSESKAKAISELQIKYETEKKAQLIKNQETALQLQRLVGLSVLSILLLFGSFIYYRIYQRRKYEQKIQELQVQQQIHHERERISRDLHDNVGSNLTRIITDLDIMSAANPDTITFATSTSISNTRSFTRQTIRLLRDTIWALNKDSFRCMEWANKVENYLAHYLEDRIDWEVDRLIQDDHLLSANEVLNLHRIVQEATQNMLKHSAATSYNVGILSNRLGTSLVIKDNGVGMKISPHEVDDHYGLYNMRRRAEEIGANFELSAADKKGFIIQVFLPVGKQ